MSSSEAPYMLATGERSTQRLQLIDRIFGSATRQLLLGCGLRRGWKVAEIGCGIGLVSFWMAQQSASVVAVDGKQAQIETAAKYAREQRIANLDFHVADAYNTGLPRASFDLVYSRFLMCHLPEPLRALREMRELLKPGGILACEDYDQQSVACEPPSLAYTRLNRISDGMDKAFGVNSSNIGLRLPRLFLQAGLNSPQVTMWQNAFLRGEEKRLWELTLEEARGAIVEHGVATNEDLDQLCAELRRIAEDETVLVMLARVTQVWATR